MFGSDDSIRRRARAIGLAVAGVVACLPGRSCCAETAVGGAAAGEAAGPMRPAAVYVRDIHDGPGLAGVPRGTVKSLRLVTHGLGRPPVDNPLAVSIHGAGRIVRVLGTVPVEADGSAYFAVPAGRPISLQPLDGQGRAVQRMRGSFVAASGQAVSCLGCHERPKAVPAGEAKALARKRPPSAISPWRGPERGFSFVREVQPVLDRRCLGCHDGEAIAGGQSIPSLKSVAGTKVSATGGRTGGPFPQSYLALHPFVRRRGAAVGRPGPMEYHASTSLLIRRLEKGHHNVKLGPAEWERLITWIDLDAPCHGTWTETQAVAADRLARWRRRQGELARRPGTAPVDPEAEAETTGQIARRRGKVRQVAPAAEDWPPDPPDVPGWPFDAAKARARQAAAGSGVEQIIVLGKARASEAPGSAGDARPNAKGDRPPRTVRLRLRAIPAGRFVMGDGETTDQNPCAVTVERPFWMAACEVTNAQYRLFDPRHDSGWVQEQGGRASANGPDQPAARVSWRQAAAFCRWLSEKTGRTFTLPTEAQWEWACRAGSAEAMWFGPVDADFGPFANLADRSLSKLALGGPGRVDFLPRAAAVDDGRPAAAPVGRYKPNPWGLGDMQGNVGEWTLTTYRPYPYREGDGRNARTSVGRKVVRGGSWRDRPERATASLRVAYAPYQKVHDVGFRVVTPLTAPAAGEK